MNLEEIATFTTALEELQSAVINIHPAIAAKALRIVLEAVEEMDHPQLELELPLATLPPVLLIEKSAVESEVNDAGELREQIAVKLVADGWDYSSALRAAKKAIAKRGKSSGLDALVAFALNLDQTKEFRPRAVEIRESHNKRRPNPAAPGALDDVVAFVRQHNGTGVSSTMLADHAGVSRSTAIRCLQAAAAADLIRCEGESRATRYFGGEASAS